ncbi:MAG: hypothetical protein KGI73_04975, partial [Patescibacteria group bacterium]|nr:hypothetical protein [Patescibacteria group bacterium]
MPTEPATQKIPSYVQAPYVIDNLGSLGVSRRANGKLNSGYSKYSTSWGIDPFTKPGALGWQEQLTVIDSGHSTITDLIVQMKARVESGTPYAYSADYAGNVYKHTLSSDAVSAIITSSGLTLNYGGGLDFFNLSTEKLFIGHDAGVKYFAFDGTGGTAITSGVTWVSNVPRPLKAWQNYIYAANDNQLVQINSSGTVTNADILNGSLPQDYHIIDLDNSADGVYLKILITRTPAVTLKTTDPTNNAAAIDFQVVYWNGTDEFITAQEFYYSMGASALHTFGQTALIFGQDFLGGLVRDENQKIASLPLTTAPRPACTDSSGDLALFACLDYMGSKQKLSIFAVGTTDEFTNKGIWRLHQQAAQVSTMTDVATVACFKMVQNSIYGTSLNASQPLTNSKFYVSCYEVKSGGNGYNLYKGTLTPQGTGTPMLGVFETETEIFPQSVQFGVARVYFEQP